MKASTTAEREPVGALPFEEAGVPVRRTLRESPIVLTLVAKAAEALTLVELVTLVPRALGPADYGPFAVVLAVVSIVSMSPSLGGPVLLSRFVPAAPPAQQKALALALAVRVGRFRAAMVTGAVVVVAVLATVDPQRLPPFAALFLGLALLLDVAAPEPDGRWRHMRARSGRDGSAYALHLLAERRALDEAADPRLGRQLVVLHEDLSPEEHHLRRTCSSVPSKRL